MTPHDCDKEKNLAGIVGIKAKLVKLGELSVIPMVPSSGKAAGYRACWLYRVWLVVRIAQDQNDANNTGKESLWCNGQH